MHSKFGGYFLPSRSRQRQSSLYNTENLTSEESDYYGSASSKNDPPLRFIIIRHGERVDNTFGAGWTQHAFNYAGQYHPFDTNMPQTLPFRTNWVDYAADTPLTANGLKQSRNVGSDLARHNMPVVACYSSPAIRSIQTADQILEGMGRKGLIPIRLELGLFECSSWYAQTPINFISDQELLMSGIPIDTRYRSQVKSLRPFETEYQYYERSKETMKKLIKLHRKTGGTVLLVAHAPSPEVLTRHLMKGLPRPEQLVALAGKVGYCGMAIVDGYPASKSWQFRYSLDDQIHWQQQQLEQYNNMANYSEIASYQPTAVPANYMIPTTLTTPQFQVYSHQDAYSLPFVT